MTHGTADDPPTASRRLLVRSSRTADESQAGFALRLAFENGLAKPSWLGTAAGESVTSPGLGRARWCPACLRRPAPLWRAGWGRGPALCVEHRCWLEDTCPDCRKQASWRTLRFLSCRCGASLLPPSGNAWSDDVSALLTAPVDPSGKGWSHLPIESRWRVAELLGALDRHGLFGKPLKRASAASVDVERQLITAGGALMLGAPSTIADLLDRIQSRVEPSSRARLVGEAFPGLLPMLRKRLDRHGREWLMRLLTSFVQASLEVDAPVVWRSRASASASGAKAVGVSLGMRPERVGSLAVALGVSPAKRVTSSGRRMIVVSPSAVERLRASRADALSMTAAADRFGLSSSRLKVLAQAGYIGRQGAGVSAASVEALVARVADRAEPLSDAPTLSVTQAMRLLVPMSRTVDFFVALLDGAVAVAATPTRPVGFRDVRVGRGAARVALGRPRSCEGLLSIPDAAAALRLKQQVTYHLIRHGLLPFTRRRVGRRVASFVSAADVEVFKKNFRPLVSLAAGAGVGSRRAVAWAEAAGLELITGPSVDGGRQYFVRVCATTQDDVLPAHVGMGNPLVPLASQRQGR